MSLLFSLGKALTPLLDDVKLEHHAVAQPKRTNLLMLLTPSHRAPLPITLTYRFSHRHRPSGPMPPSAAAWQIEQDRRLDMEHPNDAAFQLEASTGSSVPASVPL